MKKTLLITGSTDGIGKLAAIKLAKEGHQIYLHGRNVEKLNAVIAELKELSGNQNIAGFAADFSDLEQVKGMAGQIKENVSHIDVLINNAGIFKCSPTHNKEGLDIRYVVNYLAPYLLTEELMPLLDKGTDTRIVNLSSAAQSPISYEALLGKEKQSDMEAYAQSKLALTMWSFDLAKRLHDITVIPVNPGSLLNTNMVREAFGHHRSSADKGADILYDLAILEKHKGITGKYYDNDLGAFGKAYADAYQEVKIEKLMTITAKLLGA